MNFYLNWLLISFFLSISFSMNDEYIIPINHTNTSNQNIAAWKYENANSTIKIDDIYIDVFQWVVAAKNKEALSVEILDASWEFTNFDNYNIQLPKIIHQSQVLNYRDTPVVYIRLLPWRYNGNSLEVLKSAKIKISLPKPNFQINFQSPNLINSDEKPFNRQQDNNIEYLIITPERFLPYAQSLAEMHSSEVDISLQLKTEVVTTNNISTNITGIKIRDYIHERISSNLINNGFLLLFGDEIDIPPIYDYYGNYPSDDFYSTDASNMYSGKPQLKSGRLPINNINDAKITIDKIRQYTLELEPGIWKSKIALIADDNLRRCSIDINESIHTENSNIIFNSLTNLLPITPFYSIDYNIRLDNEGCEYPDLTKNLIRSINNGFALINYTGHGSPSTWADEKILTKNRDLKLINAKNNKLAIWIAGTCSFGKYINEESFMESILIKKNGAIAVIASTDAIGYTPNREFIESIFGVSNDFGIEDIINNNSKYYYKGKIRISELVHNSKNIIDNYNDYYKFHTFGDPALTLPFPSHSIELIDSSLEQVKLIEEQTLYLNNTGKQTTLLIKENDKEIFSNNNNLLYSIPGQTYTQIESDSNIICYRIPIDANTCPNCLAKFFIYQDDYGIDANIQVLSEINIENSQQLKKDHEGPKINIYQNNNQISEGSTILSGMDLNIHLHDTSGINLMNTIGHGIRYSFNDNPRELVYGDDFIYQTCSKGSINIPTTLNYNEKINSFYLEAWDGLNNRSTITINLSSINTLYEDFTVSKVFPFPNPFTNSTNFTMFCSSFPVNIKIIIFSLNGEFITELSELNSQDYFISIPWNGKNNLGHNIANGTYFYHLKIERNHDTAYEKIFKVTKIE